MAMKIKTGDKVKVLSGKDKGTEAEVIAAFPREGKVKVQGVAVVKKHCKPTQANPNGGAQGGDDNVVDADYEVVDDNK